MMSDSDDTDNLLSIPPDFFVVSSLELDDRSDCSSLKKSNPGVVSELIDHMQSLESRISAIELKETSSNLSRQLSLDSGMNFSQTLPRTKFSVSQTSNIQKTPTKQPRCSSLPSTPSIRKPYHTNLTHHPINLLQNCQKHSASVNFNLQNNYDKLKLFPETVRSATVSPNKNALHVGNGFSKKDSPSMLISSLNASENIECNNNYSSLPLLNFSSISLDQYTSDIKPIPNMNLSEVQKFLQEIDNYDNGFITRNSNCNGQLSQADAKNVSNRNYLAERDNLDKRKTMEQQKLKFNVSDYPLECEKKKDLTDSSVFNDTFSSLNTEKFMTEYKPWSPSFDQKFSDSKISITEQKNFEEIDNFNINHQKKVDYVTNNTDFSVETKRESIQQYLDANLISRCTDEFTKSQTFSSISAPQISQNISNSKSLPTIYKTQSNVSIANKPSETPGKRSEILVNGFDGNYALEQSTVNIVNSIENRSQRPQRLLTLSDLLNNDSNKSLEEQLRNKLEKEIVQREHCEKVIQDLQKKLLEKEEKIAVALRVDNEKNSIICQFQVWWKKTKQRLCELESERGNLDKLLKSMSDKHQSEVNSCQEQIKSYKEELSKALNLATGYKEKSDSLIKEKIDMLNTHANELQNYKSLVQQAEARYEEMKGECQKLFEKNQQTDENLRVTQQDLNKELLKNSEVRDEISVIHKALDTCEAELIILRQEKENLQLKLKEEVNRNNILEQSKAALIQAVNEGKESEKLAKSEIKSLTEQQEKLRIELRDVYQKQVDEVVKAKLQEFQTQLDSAEMIFQNEIETKQLAIAECAARKIKSVIDKHRLEINLIEEKHKEEKKLFEIKAAQATQKAAILEAQLNSYQKCKNQLVEQLHSMLQKQWQQALLIISEGNAENMSSIKKISVDKIFTLPSEKNLDFISNHCSPPNVEQVQRSSSLQTVHTQEYQSDNLVTLVSHGDTPLSSKKETTSDLRKYIKMILDMQQAKEDYMKPKFFNSSPPTNKESEKQSSQKETNTSNEGSSTWQPISEISAHDTSEYLSVPQKFNFKHDPKQKPPWK